MAVMYASVVAGRTESVTANGMCSVSPVPRDHGRAAAGRRRSRLLGNAVLLRGAVHLAGDATTRRRGGIARAMIAAVAAAGDASAAAAVCVCVRASCDAHAWLDVQLTVVRCGADGVERGGSNVCGWRCHCRRGRVRRVIHT